MSKTIRYFFENFADCFRICGIDLVHLLWRLKLLNDILSVIP